MPSSPVRPWVFAGGGRGGGGALVLRCSRGPPTKMTHLSLRSVMTRLWLRLDQDDPLPTDV